MATRLHEKNKQCRGSKHAARQETDDWLAGSTRPATQAANEVYCIKVENDGDWHIRANVLWFWGQHVRDQQHIEARFAIEEEIKFNLLPCHLRRGCNGGDQDDT